MNNIQAPASWHTYIEEWLGYLRTSAEAESTVNHRRYQISHLARGALSDLINITESDLIAWFASKGYAPETRKSYRAAIRSYFIWMQTAGYRDDNPALVLPKVRQTTTSSTALPRGLYSRGSIPRKLGRNTHDQTPG
jgi:site-specific recombinase XerD